MSTGLIAVSTMTEREFGVVFAKLAIQLRWLDPDVVAIKSYYEALKDFTLPVIEASARAISVEPGRRFFPTTGEWAERAKHAAAEQLKAALPHRDEPWKVECQECEDTGWNLGLECYGDTGTCGRTTTHMKHTYTRACFCRPTNRTFLRHSQFGRGTAE